MQGGEGLDTRGDVHLGCGIVLFRQVKKLSDVYRPDPISLPDGYSRWRAKTKSKRV